MVRPWLTLVLAIIALNVVNGQTPSFEPALLYGLTDVLNISTFEMGSSCACSDPHKWIYPTLNSVDGKQDGDVLVVIGGFEFFFDTDYGWKANTSCGCTILWFFAMNGTSLPTLVQNVTLNDMYGGYTIIRNNTVTVFGNSTIFRLSKSGDNWTLSSQKPTNGLRLLADSGNMISAFSNIMWPQSQYEQYHVKWNLYEFNYDLLEFNKTREPVDLFINEFPAYSSIWFSPSPNMGIFMFDDTELVYARTPISSSACNVPAGQLNGGDIIILANIGDLPHTIEFPTCFIPSVEVPPHSNISIQVPVSVPFYGGGEGGICMIQAHFCAINSSMCMFCVQNQPDGVAIGVISGSNMLYMLPVEPHNYNVTQLFNLISGGRSTFTVRDLYEFSMNYEYTATDTVTQYSLVEGVAASFWTMDTSDDGLISLDEFVNSIENPALVTLQASALTSDFLGVMPSLSPLYFLVYSNHRISTYQYTTSISGNALLFSSYWEVDLPFRFPCNYSNYFVGAQHYDPGAFGPPGSNISSYRVFGCYDYFMLENEKSVGDESEYGVGQFYYGYNHSHVEDWLNGIPVKFVATQVGFFVLWFDERYDLLNIKMQGLCPQGEEYLSGQCVKCDPGYYQPHNFFSQCLPCPAGTYTTVPGQSVCLNCGIGSYSSLVGGTSCTQCVPGTYTKTNQSTSVAACQPCPVGTYYTPTGCALCTGTQYCPLATTKPLNKPPSQTISAVSFPDPQAASYSTDVAITTSGLVGLILFLIGVGLMVVLLLPINRLKPTQKLISKINMFFMDSMDGHDKQHWIKLEVFCTFVYIITTVTFVVYQLVFFFSASNQVLTTLVPVKEATTQYKDYSQLIATYDAYDIIFETVMMGYMVNCVTTGNTCVQEVQLTFAHTSGHHVDGPYCTNTNAGCQITWVYATNYSSAPEPQSVLDFVLNINSTSAFAQGWNINVTLEGPDSPNSIRFKVMADSNKVLKGDQATVVDLSYGLYFFNDSNVFQIHSSTTGGRKVLLQQFQTGTMVTSTEFPNQQGANLEIRMSRNGDLNMTVITFKIAWTNMILTVLSGIGGLYSASSLMKRALRHLLGATCYRIEQPQSGYQELPDSATAGF